MNSIRAGLPWGEPLASEPLAMPWYKKLHVQIIMGLVLGLVYGVVAAWMGWAEATSDWVVPFGTIFLNLLKLIAVPLVLASLITGVASLSDLRKLSRIGSKTIGIYLATTLVALLIGLTVVNVLAPGKIIPVEVRSRLQEAYRQEADASSLRAEEAERRGPLQPLVDMVPENVFGAASNNGNMLQVVFVALMLGIGLLLVPAEKAGPVYAFFDGLNDVIIRLVELIMYTAPLGVFALMAGTITSIAGERLTELFELLGALGYYTLAVVFGLLLHLGITYPALLRLFSPIGLKQFFVGMASAQLVAFSTSSSGATLPVTMECAENNLGISEEISSFVLPLGATINMDGTALYQAVAAVFIAQAFAMNLDLAGQVTIVLTAMLASIGTAAVPGAGIVMLVIILESVGIPSAGIALILGVDRILDMVRTVVNVTGDATVAMLVAAAENEVTLPG